MATSRQVRDGEGGAGPSNTQQVAMFASSLAFDDLSADVVHAARRSILDWLGVSIAGRHHETSRGALQTMRQIGGTGEATVIGETEGMSPYAATLVNGVFAHVLDWDDSIYPTRMHAGAFVLPPLLAEGESRDASGRDLVLGFVIAFEIAHRLMLAMYPDYGVKRWHGSGIAGAAAVGAAVGSMMRLDHQQVTHAIGIGASGGVGMLSALGTSAKSLIMGNAGATGLQAAYLAREGWTSPEDMIGEGGGFLKLYDDHPKYDEVVDNLGSRWYVLDNGFKPYACGMVAHAAIDVSRELRALAPPGSELSSMRLRVSPETMAMMGNPDPRTGLQSKFSARYGAAVAWVDGDVGPDAFEDASVTNAAYQATRVLIEMIPDDSVAQYEAHGEVETSDGWNGSVHVPHASGTDKNPFTDDQLRAKFSHACSLGGYRESDQLADAVMAVEDVSIRDLAAKIQEGFRS